MTEFIFQPEVYRTGSHNSLINLLEELWTRPENLGSGTYYIISGFGNYNGGIRFFPTFKRHIDSGGRIVSFFGASTSMNQTSRQLVSQLLDCGCEVHLINRKHIFHSKCYGASRTDGESLVVTSGNFTSLGMAHNVESSIYIVPELTNRIGFRWSELERSILSQRWEIYRPTLDDMEAPAWSLLFNEAEARLSLDDSQEMTLIMVLGHADTARINAAPGSSAALGTQYFWLSKDCYDFFPPLTIPNRRGRKSTYSTLIQLHYVDLDLITQTRVTFEAENNFDFRLGTGQLRNTELAEQGDLAVITRIAEYYYQIRIIRQISQVFGELSPYATTFIGHQGKRYGFMSNERLQDILNIQLPSQTQFRRLLN